MIQRQTQQAEYWTHEFAVTEDDIAHLYDLILEVGAPRTSAELAIALIQERCEQEEDRLRQNLSRGAVFQPQDTYVEGAQLIFPAFDYASATVVGKRPGHSVRYGDFTVIQVRFDESQPVREFASELKADHVLNLGDGEDMLSGDGLLSPEELYAAHGATVVTILEAELTASQEFLNWDGEWFLRGLVPDIHEGYRNIVEAVVDIEGRPMEVDALVPQLDVLAELKPRTQAFSLNYALSRDSRFEDVGPVDEVQWFLRRMEPEAAHEKPPRLQYEEGLYDPTIIRPDLFPWVREFADELTNPRLQPTWEPEPAEATFVLIHPHRRAGTLPLTPQTTPFFPRKAEGIVYITFHDAQTGTQWPGWVVGEQGYVAGLKEWYGKVSLPAGGYLILRHGQGPQDVVIERRSLRRREWVRVAGTRGSRLSFEMQTRMVECGYDDLMLIVEDDPANLDRVWRRANEERQPVFDILCQVFPELSKLNPQGTVHVKTLYAATNVVRRCPPGPILAELSRRACFIPVGDGYWSYDERRR